jgi:hypothetical protein
MKAAEQAVVRSDLHALLQYSLYAPTWTARKQDKRITAEIKASKGVDSDTDAGNFNKFLLPDFPELNQCKSYIGHTRQEFYLRTAPWGEMRGVRVGKAEEHMDMMSWFGDRRADFEPIKAAMLAKYSEQITLAEFKLNDMFDSEDYPDVEKVESRFQLRLSAMPLPNVNDVRVLTDIPKHVRQEIEDAITADINASFTATLTHGFQQLYKPIQHMADTLEKYKDGEIKRLFDSVVENVRVMSEMAHKLNVSRDPTLEAFAIEAGGLVDALTAKDLRDSEGMQVLVAKKAQDLAARIAMFMP